MLRAVENLDIIDVGNEPYLPANGSLDLAWAEAVDACPDGWSIRGIGETGKGRYMATAFGPDPERHVPCPTCGQTPEDQPTVLQSMGASPAEALDALAARLRALA